MIEDDLNAFFFGGGGATIKKDVQVVCCIYFQILNVIKYDQFMFTLPVSLVDWVDKTGPDRRSRPDGYYQVGSHQATTSQLQVDIELSCSALVTHLQWIKICRSTYISLYFLAVGASHQGAFVTAFVCTVRTLPGAVLPRAQPRKGQCTQCGPDVSRCHVAILTWKMGIAVGIFPWFFPMIYWLLCSGGLFWLEHRILNERLCELAMIPFKC